MQIRCTNVDNIISSNEIKNMEKPPKTIRYCLICDKPRKFIYDPNVGHSRCEDCNNTRGLKAKNITDDDLKLKIFKDHSRYIEITKEMRIIK